jgi:hypothetical protein
MARAPYVDERKVEYWTSRELDTFFENEGFDVISLPLTAVTEKSVPSDFAFLDRGTSKLFGFQYKVLHHNGRDHWNLDEEQHRQLRLYNWIYYGLSDLTSLTQQRNALHYLRIVPVGFDYASSLSRNDFQQAGARYFRWAGFFEGLQKCKYGRKITSRKDLQRALWPLPEPVPREIAQIVSEAFLVDLADRRITKFSSRAPASR